MLCRLISAEVQIERFCFWEDVCAQEATPAPILPDILELIPHANTHCLTCVSLWGFAPFPLCVRLFLFRCSIWLRIAF